MRWAVYAGLLAMCASCSNTGILIEVTSRFDRDVHELSVYVGYPNDDGTGKNYRDADPLRDVVLDRSLVESPYTVLVGHAEVEPAPMIVVAVSHDQNGNPDGFGFVTDVEFREGHFLKYTIELGAVPGDFFESDTCITLSDGSSYVDIGLIGDLDCDGSPDDEDCDPHNSLVHPGGTENCQNGIDDDCDGKIDQPADNDGDGFMSCGDDCDDGNAQVSPDAEEACNGIDDNCNGSCDEIFDVDGDGFLGPECTSGVRVDCNPGGQDCADSAPQDNIPPELIHPGADEVCNGIDDNCDGSCDEEFDDDGDGYLDPNQCLSGVTTDCEQGPADCSSEEGVPPDENALVNPGQIEICDGIDNDCDPATPERTSDVCFTRNSTGDCVGGFRACMMGSLSDCVEDPDGVPVPDDFCDAFDDCASDPDPLGCFEQDLGNVNTFHCRVAFVSDASICQQNAAQLESSSTTVDTCRWTLVGGTFQQGFEAGLRRPSTANTPAATIDVCDPEFVVEGVALNAAAATFILYEELNGSGTASQVVVLDFQARQVANCDTPIQMCQGLKAATTP